MGHECGADSVSQWGGAHYTHAAHRRFSIRQQQLKSSKKKQQHVNPEPSPRASGARLRDEDEIRLNDNNKLTTKARAPSQDPPRTGAFEVVLRAPPPMVSSSKAEDKTLWSKLQVGEPSSSEPETLRAVSNAILMELRSALNREA